MALRTHTSAGAISNFHHLADNVDSTSKLAATDGMIAIAIMEGLYVSRPRIDFSGRVHNICRQLKLDLVLATLQDEVDL